MTVEPPIPDRAETADDGDIDLTVAGQLGPLTAVVPPDLWTEALRRAASDQSIGTTDPEPRRRYRPSGLVRAALTAAAATVLVSTVVTLTQSGGHDGQVIDTPAAGFPAGVVAGPALALDQETPVGAFAVVYAAGVVVVEADGHVVGHYTGQVPGVVYDPARGTVGRMMGGPDGCSFDPANLTVLFCRDAVGPTVEVAGEGGLRRVIASFPSPPAGIDPSAAVSGHLVRAFAQPGIDRGRPLLLQMSAECETRLALMVEDPIGTDGSDRGGVIRRLDGASYWDEPTMAGESLALGWSPDGGEAYVWRFNGPCDTALDQPGVYAYRLDGSSRLLMTTPADVVDVQLITGDIPTAGPGAITPLPSSSTLPDPSSTVGGAVTAATQAEPLPGWSGWAGPLLADDARTRAATATDRGLVAAFARSELGMINPDLALSATDLDPAVWVVTEGAFSVKLQPGASYGDGPVSPEERAAWNVAWAITFWPRDEDYLRAQVTNETGRWTATFRLPAHGSSTVMASYTLGDRTLDPTSVEVVDGRPVIRFDLESEPTVPATLTVRWTKADGTQLVGYQRSTFPPGAFAAG